MNTIPTAPGTVALTYDTYDCFDLYPVLAFDLSDSLPSARVWVVGQEDGFPWRLCEDAPNLRRAKILHPPVLVADVLDFVDSVMFGRGVSAFARAEAAGAAYYRGERKGVIHHAWRPHAGDEWRAPDEARPDIEAFNLIRTLAAYARSGDTTSLLAANEDEDWDGGFAPPLVALLREGDQPLSQTG
jgi:hypothetical protein